MTNRIDKTGNRTGLSSPRLPAETCTSRPKAITERLSSRFGASAGSKGFFKNKKIKMPPTPPHPELAFPGTRSADLNGLYNTNSAVPVWASSRHHNMLPSAPKPHFMSGKGTGVRDGGMLGVTKKITWAF